MEGLEKIDWVRSAKYSPQLSCQLPKHETMNNCKPPNWQINGLIRTAVRYTMFPRSPIRVIRSAEEARAVPSIFPKRHMQSWLRTITTLSPISSLRIYSNKTCLICVLGIRPFINSLVSKIKLFFLRIFSIYITLHFLTEQKFTFSEARIVFLHPEKNYSIRMKEKGVSAPKHLS